MRQTSYDKATATIHAVDDAELVIAKTIKAYAGPFTPRLFEEQAHEITQALDKAGFEVRYRPIDIVPEPAPAVVMVSRVTHEDGSVTERRSAPVETETEKAARWASVLIAQVLEDGSARQAEAGVAVAAKEALVRLRRDRGRMAFEDLDRNPPSAAGGACELLAAWVRSLGDVNWCEVRLLPRRLVLAASVRGRPSREQEEDLGRRFDMIRAFRGVVGLSPGVRGLHSEDGVVTYEVEVRFDFYITTVGCTFAPLDLPAKPAKAAA